MALALFSEIERTQQVIESEVIGDWQNVYLLAPSPDGTISNPSTKIARQCHSAEWRERIFFPLSFAFFALALLATVLFAEQMCWLAFLLALRAVYAALAEGDEAFFFSDAKFRPAARNAKNGEQACRRRRRGQHSAG